MRVRVVLCMTQHIDKLALTARVYMINVCARCGRLILCGDRCLVCCEQRATKRRRKQYRLAK